MALLDQFTAIQRVLCERFYQQQQQQQQPQPTTTTTTTTTSALKLAEKNTSKKYQPLFKEKG